MRELEDMLRAASHQPLNEHPAPGQWEALQEKLARRKRFWLPTRWLLGGSVLLLLGLGLIYALSIKPLGVDAERLRPNSVDEKVAGYYYDDQVDANSFATKETDELASPVARDTDHTELAAPTPEVAHTTGPTLAVNTTELTIAGDDHLGKSRQSIKEPLGELETGPALAVTSVGMQTAAPSDPPELLDDTPAADLFEQIPVPLKTIPALSAPPSKAVNVKSYAPSVGVRLAHRVSELPIYSDGVGAYVGAKLRPDPGVWLLKGGEKGRWEIGLEAFYSPGSFTGFINRYTTEAPSPPVTPEILIVDGNSELLYFDGSETEDFRTSIPLFRLTLNRQTRSGFRYGIGLVYFNETLDLSSKVQSLSAAEPQVFFQGFFSRTSYLLGNVNLGYTFLRRRRIQPFVEIGASMTVRESVAFESYIYRDSRKSVQTSAEIVNGFGTYNLIIPHASIGAMYRLNERFSVGLSIAPVLTPAVQLPVNVGAQVRYGF